MLGLLTGGLSGLLTSVFTWYKERDALKLDHANEMEKLRFMAEQNKLDRESKLEEIRTNADMNSEVARFQAIGATQYEFGNASKWVDNLNGIVRPLWAFYCMLIMLVFDFGVYHLVKTGFIMPTDSMVSMAVSLNIDVVMYILSYYFVARSTKAVLK